MPLEEAMMTQRAVRRVKPDPIDDSLVLHLIELALKAPVGSNQQVWDFIVLKDREAKAKLARLYRTAGRPYLAIGRRVQPKMGKVMDAVQWQMDHFDQIPVVVVACFRGRPPVFPFIAATSWYGSIYPAVQNLLLAARAAGIGCNLVTMPLWNSGAVRRILGLPSDVTPVAFVPMGWPLGRYGPTTRRPVGDVVHVDRYGNQPYRQSPPAPRQSKVPAAIARGLALGTIAMLAWMLRD